MVLELEGGEIMEYLWDQIDKTDDGNHIRYTIDDVDSLWWTGFVDTEKYPLNVWRKAFEPFRQEDDSFIVNRDDFLALERYRYTGEIRIPFDAMKINEGKYTEEGLQELLELSVAPSCGKSPQELKEFMDELKQRFRQPDGLITVGRPFKMELQGLLDYFPSPLRCLELILDRMIEEGGADKVAGEMLADETARATTEAAKQVSRFSAAPTTKAEVQSQRLRNLQKAKPKAKETPATKADEKKGTELKKIRRSRRGMRG